MLKKLLYLYNDGHNPFPNMKGKGLHLIGGKYEYDDNPDDDQVYDSGFITGNYEPVGDDKFRIIDEYGNVIDVDRNEPIDPPNYYGNSTSIDDDDDNDAEIFGYDEDDDELQSINDEIKEIKDEIRHNTQGEKVDTYPNKLKLLEEEEQTEKRNIITSRIQQKKISDNFSKLSHIADIEFMMSIKNLTEKQRDRILELFEDVMQDLNKNSKPNDEDDDMKRILTGVKKIVIVTKQPEIKILRRLYDQAVEAMNMPFLKIDAPIMNFLKKYTTTLVKLAFPDEMKTITELNRKEMIAKERIEEIKEDKKYISGKISYIDTKNEEIKLLQKQYGERKKILDQKKRKPQNKQKAEIDPEQAKRDLQELKAEMKEKEALAAGQQLSKTAQKKANAAAKKALAEKQAEAPVVNAQASLASKGTYGKKLEDFFTEGGQPILQKFTGDSSKIHDIEKDEIIPDEEVTFNNGKKNSLRKACTLDLYNDKFVFEIKNYVNNSIKDDVIPMQPSKFAGTKYFVPTYLEDGRLYSLNLNYISPKTGKHYTQNILPPNSHGREVVFVIRLKEGLFQYKPFFDKENNKLIPNGEFASGKRPLYFFDETKLKKCKDYEGNPAFNLKGHLTPI
jgi:uncharacterized protein YlzI (FlbEa/FlbD family)